MARRRRRRIREELPRTDPDHGPGVRFELEEDADEIFRAYVEGHDPPPTSDHDTPMPKERRPRRPEAPHVLDLHGRHLDAARSWLRSEIGYLLAGTKPGEILWLRIVTGRGRRSGVGGPVLSREIHGFVARVWGQAIVRMDASPAETAIDGLPVRGHFDVVLRRPRR